MFLSALDSRSRLLLCRLKGRRSRHVQKTDHSDLSEWIFFDSQRQAENFIGYDETLNRVCAAVNYNEEVRGNGEEGNFFWEFQREGHEPTTEVRKAGTWHKTSERTRRFGDGLLAGRRRSGSGSGKRSTRKIIESKSSTHTRPVTTTVPDGPQYSNAVMQDFGRTWGYEEVDLEQVEHVFAQNDRS